MTNNPFFSIVIPTYNRANFISNAIESVLAQSFKDFEVIVVDDGSGDDTEMVVNNILSNKIKYIKRENGERGAARNTGIKHASGRYITFLDSDDILYPHHLSTAFEILIKNKFPEILHSAYEITGTNGMVLKRMNKLKSINKDIIKGNPLSCIGVFIRQDVMSANLFNEDRDLSGLEDWELWLRISAKHRFLCSNVITAAISQHDQRSVLNEKQERLILKSQKFIHYVVSDKNNQAAFGSELRRTLASVKTYVALHLALARAPNKLVWKYLMEGIFDHQGELFRRRFLVILTLMMRLKGK